MNRMRSYRFTCSSGDGTTAFVHCELDTGKIVIELEKGQTEFCMEVKQSRSFAKRILKLIGDEND